MSSLSRYRVLILGVLSPVLAVLLSILCNDLLLRLLADAQKKWLLRLTLSTAAMVLPFAITLILGVKDRHTYGWRFPTKIGLVLAVLSLGLMAKPVSDGFTRTRQEANKQRQGVPAPLFETSDLAGNRQRLADYKGKVVLVNIWATWCAPCRAEMPALDRLYEERKDQGFIVLGMSDETNDTQNRFLQQVRVSYPLLLLTKDMPSFYRDIARYPEVFLIDRAGRLQSTPQPGRPFEELEKRVDTLLKGDRLP